LVFSEKIAEKSSRQTKIFILKTLVKSGIYKEKIEGKTVLIKKAITQ